MTATIIRIMTMFIGYLTPARHSYLHKFTRKVLELPA
jgi:hypothetical protein